jgi:hypothetical protein
MADGKQTDDETKALGQLVAILKIDVKEAKTIIAGAADGALSLSSRSLT